MGAVTLITGAGSSMAEGESTTTSVSNIGAATLSTDDKSCKIDTQNATFTVNEMGIEVDDESATNPDSKALKDQILNEHLEETALGLVDIARDKNTDEDEAETDSKALMEQLLREQTEDTTSDLDDIVEDTEMKEDENATTIVSKTPMEHILRDQTEETRLNLAYIAADKDMNEIARFFAEVVAAIVEWWQWYAKEEDPTCYQIDFGVGSPITLLMVLALLPEKYQGFICIEDTHRSASGNGENFSWLHEQTMDVLARLSIDPSPASILFGQGLASMVRNDVDEGWRVFTGRSWLEDQIHLLSNNELEPDLYRFPPETKKIVFFFNPTEVHWTVVEVDLNDDVWTYTLYNSLFKGEKGPTWKACQEQFPLLEQLVCRASGFSKPKTREIIAATSAQQDNPYDCGPIAIYNATELLKGRRPNAEVDTENLRLRYLQVIVDALCLLDEGLKTPAFRARMRKVYFDDYPTRF